MCVGFIISLLLLSGLNTFLCLDTVSCKAVSCQKLRFDNENSSGDLRVNKGWTQMGYIHCVQALLPACCCSVGCAMLTPMQSRVAHMLYLSVKQQIEGQQSLHIRRV